mmetsp:Transcript_84585/g.141394  ORF Transcript_84585/g.141394 Transcript_84585/m.141394 type:complete len:216 (-) Transcript_84585:1532-2179(-)
MAKRSVSWRAKAQVQEKASLTIFPPTVRNWTSKVGTPTANLKSVAPLSSKRHRLQRKPKRKAGAKAAAEVAAEAAAEAVATAAAEAQAGVAVPVPGVKQALTKAAAAVRRPLPPLPPRTKNFLRKILCQKMTVLQTVMMSRCEPRPSVVPCHHRTQDTRVTKTMMTLMLRMGMKKMRMRRTRLQSAAKAPTNAHLIPVRMPEAFSAVQTVSAPAR